MKIEIRSKVAKNTLERAINKEVASLKETMDNCDQSDFMQYQAYLRAKDQLEELEIVKANLNK